MPNDYIRSTGIVSWRFRNSTIVMYIENKKEDLGELVTLLCVFALSISVVDCVSLNIGRN